MSRQFLVCDSAQHAEVCDQFVCQYLRDRDGNMGGSWSGVYAKPGLLSDTYGILWDSPCGEVFGDPETEGFTVEDDANGVWVPMPEPDPVAEGL